MSENKETSVQILEPLQELLKWTKVASYKKCKISS